ncbi:MAG: hypothetical protein MEQ74_05095 [Paracoccus sp.]|nr:hypothetical protein [Paracoccus sp. (in: a-proteobacteria)]
MLDLFRHHRVPDVKEGPEDYDLGNLGEIIAFPPNGIPNARDNDPCVEVLPRGRETGRASVR